MKTYRLTRFASILALICSLVLLGCATEQDRAPVSAAPAPAAPATPPALAFQMAVENAATALFSSAEKNADVMANAPRIVMIDPLVDGNNAQRTASSEAMGAQITGIIKNKFQRFNVAPFALPTLQRKPLLLLGTLTAINSAGDAKAKNDVYRVCLALIDVQAGKVLAKGTGRATPETVDATPTPYFHDTPTWVKDKITEGYISSCQKTKPGEAADPLYLETLPTSIMLNDAILAYDRGDVKQAHRYYRTAAAMPGGDQKRVTNGLYVTSWKLKRKSEAADAFGKIIVRGIQDQKIGVKFLFQPTNDSFVNNADLRSQYDLWLKVIAERTLDTQTCLNIVGHSGKSSSETTDEQMLSERRAGTVRSRLVRNEPKLKNRLRVEGRGSSETVVGTGSNDMRDALDRRVEFKVEKTCL